MKPNIAALKEIYDAVKERDTEKLRSIKQKQGTLRRTVDRYEAVHLFLYEKDDKAVDFLLKETDESVQVSQLALHFYALQGNIDRAEKMRNRVRTFMSGVAAYSFYKSLVDNIIDGLIVGGHLNNSYSVLRLLMQLSDKVPDNGALSIRQQYATKLMRKLEVAKGEWSAMELLPIAKVLEDKMVKHSLTFDEALLWYQHNAKQKLEEYSQKQSSTRKKQQKIQIKNNFYNIIATLSLKQKPKKANKIEGKIRSLLQKINKGKEVEVQEVKETKMEAKETPIQRMQQSKEFYSFKKAYFKEYHSHFFRNPFSRMKRKLNSLKPGEILSMDIIDVYARSHKKSRTAKVRINMRKG